MTNEDILQKLNSMSANTLMETLRIEYVEMGDDYLVAKMPVDARVHQPMGILHGGATVALAESVASAAAYVLSEGSGREVRGLEITANHLKSKSDGVVTGRATIIHDGRTTQLWEIRIEDEAGQLISLCKMTALVFDKQQKG
jgi:uncharacterized protein (TIGR00369 family)